jgi:hypothetical protein
MTRKQRVEVFANRQQLAVWEEPIHDAWSVAFQERRATVVARFGVTLLGMAVASAATVALYWTNKPFGSMADYMTPLSIGSAPTSPSLGRARSSSTGSSAR